MTASARCGLRLRRALPATVALLLMPATFCLTAQAATPEVADCATRPAVARSAAVRELTIVQADFRAALDGASKWLASHDAEVAAAWRSYLQFDELAELEALPHAEQLAALTALYERLRIDHEAIDAEPLSRLRHLVKELNWSLRLAAVDLDAEQRRCEAELDELLAKYEVDQDPTIARRIGALVDWLEHAGRSAELTESIRRRYHRPNAVVFGDIKFLNEFAERTIDETKVYRENVLGTDVVGPSRIEAKMTLETVPNDREATIVVRLAGKTRADNNVGRNGPATLFSRSQGSFDARLPLTFDRSYGLKAGRPVIACRADINVRQIHVTSPFLPALTEPILEGAAWNKAREREGAAENEVQRLMRRRLEQRIQGQIDDTLTDLRRRFHDTFYLRPLRFDKFPEVATRTTADGIEAWITQARGDQLAAGGNPLQLDPATRWGLALHESLFNNIAPSGALMGGPEKSDEQIERLVQGLASEVPPELRVFSTSVPWSVTTADAPITMRFREGRVHLTIHTRRWSIGNQAFVRAVDVQAVYRVDNSVFGATFFREGPIKIEPIGGAWTGDETATLVPHIGRKVEALLPPMGRLNNLSVPRTDGLGPVGLAQLKQLECRDGWFLMGFQRVELSEGNSNPGASGDSAKDTEATVEGTAAEQARATSAPKSSR